MFLCKLQGIFQLCSIINCFVPLSAAAAHNSAFSAVPKSFRSVAALRCVALSGHAHGSTTAALPLSLSHSSSLSRSLPVLLLLPACSFSFCSRHFVICSDCCVDCAFVKFIFNTTFPPYPLCYCCCCCCCGHLKYSYGILSVFHFHF